MKKKTRNISFFLLFNFQILVLAVLCPVHIHGHHHEYCAHRIFFSCSEVSASVHHCEQHCDGTSILEYLYSRSIIPDSTHSRKPGIASAVLITIISQSRYRTTEYFLRVDTTLRKDFTCSLQPERAPPA
ncbi:MAG TPA: hypothetical protein PK253_19635 [Spirochaetota bacterium]|nr:hypothetical protein [Spirochaetota bacterium]HPQ55473.1 hypothetical protein [Spirochaetota bacterium]